MWKGLVLTIVLPGVIACTSGDQAKENNISAIEVSQTAGSRFSQAVVEASRSQWAPDRVEALVALYTEDAILFPPKGDPIRGREAIRTYWTRTPDRRILEHSIQTERADISGDLLVEHGKFSLTFQSGTDAPASGTSNFISAYRRGPDGIWRKYLDSWW
jgi:ketosteroid isomerase-like protein